MSMQEKHETGVGVGARGTMIDHFAGRPPTVLQIVPALETGGVERTTLDIARALVDAGGKALVASRGGRMVAELEALGGQHIDMPIHSKNPIVMALNVERLTRLIKQQDIDLVHARSRAPAWSALAAARRTGRPFVTTYHSKVYNRPRLKVFYNSVMTRGDAVIANSAYTAARVRAAHKTDEARIFTVPRGIDTDYFDPARVSTQAVARLRTLWGITDTARPVFLLPARLTRWKGHTVAIEAARLLKGAGYGDFRLVLIGDALGRDQYVSELTASIVMGNLGSIVSLAGHGADMPTAYALADCVLSPSTKPEPFGRVAVEAQLMGKPVIVSDEGAARETVLSPHDEGGPAAATGWRVPANDATALAEAMRDVLALGPGGITGRVAMGARGRAHILSHYSLAAMCDATLSIYAQLLQHR